MFFRNLTLFRFPTSLDVSGLESQLSACALKPVGPLELSSRGFIPPFGRDAEALSHRIGDALWLTVGNEDKLLPGAVVNDLLQKKLAELEQKEGRRPGGRTRKRLKEDLVIRKFKLLDGAVDQLESTERDDLHAELDARFALMSGEVKRLFSVLEPALKLSRADA